MCYQPLHAGEVDFHAACAKQFFGQPIPPMLPYATADMEALAKEVIQSQIMLTGVQPKISLHLSKKSKHEARTGFTVVGLQGGYILKPPAPYYEQLPEVEDLTMHLAALSKIKIAPHSLIRLADGQLAYLTKRMDRVKTRKLAMEDMCQLTDRLTEYKYLGSYEQIGKSILQYSASPGLDLVNLFELLLFCFLTGNADMHLKNFSLLEQPGFGMTLAPAYDLVNTALVNPADTEELALNLNGKKKKIERHDFVAAMNTLRLDEKQQQNIFNKMTVNLRAWEATIAASFLSEEYKAVYWELVSARAERLFA
ncbi:MAG: HipA domain-containing protein [Bacteroidia bacterium]